MCVTSQPAVRGLRQLWNRQVILDSSALIRDVMTSLHVVLRPLGRAKRIQRLLSLSLFLLMTPRLLPRGPRNLLKFEMMTSVGRR